MQMSSNYFWNSMLFIGWLTEVSEDITNAVCIILKLSAWLGTTRIRMSSKKKIFFEIWVNWPQGFPPALHEAPGMQDESVSY